MRTMGDRTLGATGPRAGQRSSRTSARVRSMLSAAPARRSSTSPAAPTNRKPRRAISTARSNDGAWMPGDHAPSRGRGHHSIERIEHVGRAQVGEALEPEREAQVGGADVHAVETGDGADRLDVRPSLRGLDLHEREDRLVGRVRLPAARPERRPDRPVAPHAERRVPAETHEGGRVIGGVHHRTDHAPGSQVERPHHGRRVVPADPDERDGTRALDRADDVAEPLQGLLAVLQVDGHGVEPGRREDPGRRTAPERRPRVQRHLARDPTIPNPIGHGPHRRRDRCPRAAAQLAVVRARTRYPSTGNRKRSGPLGRTFEWKVRSSGP